MEGCLEQERQGLLRQIRELDELRENLPVRREIEELEMIRERQIAYRNRLGWFHGSDRKRIEAQIQEKDREIAERKAELENAEHAIEDQINDLGLAICAIETEMDRG